MIKLENDKLQINLKLTGAELTRVYHKQSGIEYIWNANPEYWAKHAPVLFPIVGTLKNNTYFFEGKAYNLSRHGFARDRTFQCAKQNDTSVVFELHSDNETLKQYPFPFILRISYSIEANKLITRYEVINTGKTLMHFSIGGHPAFNVPLKAGLNYEDYYLEFEKSETAPRWPLEDNLVKTRPEPFLKNEKIIPLHHMLFNSDAIILKHIQSKTISLKSKASEHGLTMRIEEFPYLGIWAAPDAPFVCIEPWQGLADSLYHDQKIENKEGIVKLGTNQVWTKSWDISFL